MQDFNSGDLAWHQPAPIFGVTKRSLVKITKRRARVGFEYEMIFLADPRYTYLVERACLTPLSPVERLAYEVSHNGDPA